MKIRNGIILAILYVVIVSWSGQSFAQQYWAASAALPISGRLILIDAGHGGADPGKTGTMLDEKDLNLAIAGYLQAYLEMGGAAVLMTRVTDEMLSDGEAATKKGDMRLRGEMIRQYAPDLVISIHQNSFPGGQYWGPQVFYWQTNESGRRLAEGIQEQLNIFTGGTRQCKANSDYYILKQSDKTAVLVECGFLTNPEEEIRLNDAIYQKKIAWSIYSGIIGYFEEEEHGNTVDTHGGS
jgi:N-acetylmuramoyl-L-alanine amidase